MKSSRKLRRWCLAWLPRSIAARSSLAILALAVVLGLTFSLMASWRVRAAEYDRLLDRVDELTSTVESTVSVACYLNDRTLAQEIATGLMKNDIIAGVRITASGETLYAGGAETRVSPLHGHVDAVARDIHSPFNPRTTVGRITLFVSHAQIEAQAAGYSRYIKWILGLTVSIVAVAVALVVYLLVIRPIKRTSDELHRLDFHSGMRLSLPAGRRTDEIGQLVLDVNMLIGRLGSALATERDLRLAQEVSERRMRLVFERADTGMLLLDERGVVQSSNPAFVRILGLQGVVPGMKLTDLLAPHGALVDELIGASRGSGQSRETDLEIDASGARGKIWVELSVNPLGPNLLQGLVNDITERKRAESAARELAARDAVTGTLNRRGIDTALASLLTMPRHNDPGLALLQIDLDFFKAVNDTHGHEAGDRVLRAVAQVLERCVRRTDIVGRVGGDEFVVILPGVEGTECALEVADNIIAGVREPIDLGDGRQARIGASVGIALASPIAESPAAFMRRADTAMYAAKQAGRGRAMLAPSVESPESDSSDDSDSVAA